MKKEKSLVSEEYFSVSDGKDEISTFSTDLSQKVDDDSENFHIVSSKDLTESKTPEESSPFQEGDDLNAQLQKFEEILSEKLFSLSQDKIFDEEFTSSQSGSEEKKEEIKTNVPQIENPPEIVPFFEVLSPPASENSPTKDEKSDKNADLSDTTSSPFAIHSVEIVYANQEDLHQKEPIQEEPQILYEFIEDEPEVEVIDSATMVTSESGIPLMKKQKESPSLNVEFPVFFQDHSCPNLSSDNEECSPLASKEHHVVESENQKRKVCPKEFFPHFDLSLLNTHSSSGSYTRSLDEKQKKELKKLNELSLKLKGEPLSNDPFFEVDPNVKQKLAPKKINEIPDLNITGSITSLSSDSQREHSYTSDSTFLREIIQAYSSSSDQNKEKPQSLSENNKCPRLGRRHVSSQEDTEKLFDCSSRLYSIDPLNGKEENFFTKNEVQGLSTFNSDPFSLKK